jgi:UDP-glucose 4-epimerase
VSDAPMRTRFDEAKLAQRRAGDPPELVAAPAKAKDLLGWEASYKDLSKVLETAWAWMSGPRGGRYAD